MDDPEGHPPADCLEVDCVMKLVRKLQLRPAGMFSNVNEVVEHLRLAELGGYRFFIDWHRSCYRDSTRSGDPWSYYFEPVFPNLKRPFWQLASPKLDTGYKVACTKANIITPRLRDGDCNPMLLPRDREGANRIIATYIRPNAAVTARVNAFRQDHFPAQVIGLHIRGQGKNDGGSAQRRNKHAPDGEVPLDVYFQAVDGKIATMPEAAIFACSDSDRVIDAVTGRYGDRVVTYAATRTEFGEMHMDHPENAGEAFDTYKLGMDVLVEALLLSETTVLIHGTSNVSSFALCKSPRLEHIYVDA